MEIMTMPHEESATETRVRPIIVATDGLPQSRGALAVARAMASGLASVTRVVAVHRSMALTIPDGQLLVDPNITASMRADLTHRVKEQCTNADDPTCIGDYEILNGEPARVITEVANDRRAQLIVIGLGRHEIVDRIFGDETALKVARASHIPVLAVPEHVSTVPKRAIVGIDFSEGSLRATQAALRLLIDGGVLELVHVVPRERLLFDAWVSQEEYMRFVRHSLTRFRARLTVPANISLDDVVLSGDPARELLAHAARIGAEMIAAGSHGHGVISRVVLGSVTTKLLRTANCVVLVIPADANHADRQGASVNATLKVNKARWGEVLDDFTRRNAGRRTRLEINDPALGAQPQEGDYPLLGVAFDPVDHRVEIMLGELGAGQPHLSRNIGDVDALDILTNHEDQDIALRLRHGAGQTILTLLR